MERRESNVQNFKISSIFLAVPLNLILSIILENTVIFPLTYKAANNKISKERNLDISFILDETKVLRYHCDSDIPFNKWRFT